MRGLNTNRLHAQSRLQLRFVVLVVLLVLASSVGARPPDVRSSGLLQADKWTLSGEQGFGDRQNSWAWSMQWWRGYLYVGTNRAFQCVQAQAFDILLGDQGFYPPTDPDIECPADPHDMPLQAEIWRWHPQRQWERVYQAPNDVPIPGTSPRKYASRDIGYRGMTVFTEADGKTALYVGTVSPRALGYDVPPRILRSTDGVNFRAVPQARGTVLGDFPLGSFRGLTTYNGKLYVIGGTLQGSGRLLEASNPHGGNDHFREVGPPGVEVSAVMAFNGQLYIGTRDQINGYAVYRTSAEGSLPYVYTPVVVEGGYLPEPNSEVLAMHVFQNRLYVGLNAINLEGASVRGAAELIRINPDNTWEVVVGTPRQTLTGWKYPISGFDAGFGDPYNAHMWQIDTYDDTLYVGTLDTSTTISDTSTINPPPSLGFDLYRSSDGRRFSPVTTTGFGDEFDYGVRSLEPTPYGMFLGTANPYYGLRIYRTPASEYFAYLPFVAVGAEPAEVPP
jgi:hypothetical protein